jgi:hypothetical protein
MFLNFCFFLPTVAVNGYAAIKEMETHPDFMDRLDDEFLLDKTLGLPYGKL